MHLSFIVAFFVLVFVPSYQYYIYSTHIYIMKEGPHGSRRIWTVGGAHSRRVGVKAAKIRRRSRPAVNAARAAFTPRRSKSGKRSAVFDSGVKRCKRWMESGDGLLRLAASRFGAESPLQRLHIFTPRAVPAVLTHTMCPALVFFTSASSGAEIGQLRLARGRGFPRRASYWM